MTVYVPIFGKTCYAVLKLIRPAEGAKQVAACSPILARTVKPFACVGQTLMSLARMQVYSTPLKEELIAEARFRFDLFAGFPSALGR